jgi:hypothetical protein
MALRISEIAIAGYPAERTRIWVVTQDEADE